MTYEQIREQFGSILLMPDEELSSVHLALKHALHQMMLLRSVASAIADAEDSDLIGNVQVYPLEPGTRVQLRDAARLAMR